MLKSIEKKITVVYIGSLKDHQKVLKVIRRGNRFTKGKTGTEGGIGKRLNLKNVAGTPMRGWCQNLNTGEGTTREEPTCLHDLTSPGLLGSEQT